jgi:TP901 family phage tail tape measure protein
LAKKDDLSVNINVGVNLDKASVDEAKKELQFLIELEKELGVEGAKKIRVGGYSTSASPDRTVRNKAASQIEKMGGDWSGIDIAEKAEVELAKRFNQAAEELAKVFKIDFVPEAAKALGEVDFSMPNPEEIFKNSNTAQDYGDKLQKATEDFFMNAAGEVTISPAMLMAAAERVFKNNPNIAVPRGMDKISGIINPTPAFGNVANYDQKVSEQFNQFITQAVGDNPAAATKVSDFLISKLKVLMSGIIDDAQKAREDVFKSVRGSEGDESTENIIRYADDAARRAVAMAEQARGLQPGTTAVFGRGLLPEKFRANPDAVSDPQQLLNVLIGEYSDEVTGAIMAAVPDPSKVAEPIAQILMNPYILGDKFATGYQDEINKALKRRAPAAAEVAAPVAVRTGGGAVNPDIDLLRKYLTDQKAAVEAQGKTFMAGLDTEFNSKIDEKLTELGLVIQDGTGKFVEIFKFLQLPGDLGAMEQGWQNLPKRIQGTQAKDAADLLKRGQLLGIPKENIGVPDDSEANFLQYREKISKLVSILDLLSELGISLTGSNFQAAEAANIKKAIEYVNSRSAGMGLDPLSTPDLSNVFDPATLAKKLSPGSSELAKIFDSPEAKNGISGALGNLIKNIAQQFPDFIARYSDQFKMAEGGNTFEYKAAGGSAQAHFALTDAAASLIVKDFVEEFGDNAATLLVPIAKDLNTKVQAAAGGSGGNKPPSTPRGAADKPEDDPMANRAAASLQQLLLVGQKYQNAIAGLTEAERIKVEQRLKVLQSSREQAELLGKIAELEKKRSDILAEAAEISAGVSSFASQRRSEGLQGPLTQSDSNSVKRYNDQIRSASLLQTEIRELTEAGRDREKQVISAVKEESRYKQVSEQLTDNFRKQYDAQLQNAQAGKTATNSIKAQMQEQVNAQKAVQRQTQSLMNTWVTSRYALYDVGNFYQSVAQNLIRVSRQIFNTTESYRRFETSFTSVERAMQLTGVAATDMRNQFVLLSETIPVAFEDIARIGTLGAQMGIASDGIIGFTETVSKFSSITGISAETVAQQFGRIAELADVDPTQFNNLGSAVAFAGINAVATETEILNLTQSIAAVSNQSGMTAPEIVAIATALASVGIQAEQARGVFTRVFADIDRAAQGGGESLQALAEVTGLSAETISGSWGKEGAANDVFIALLEGLDSADNLTAAFDKLNIVETREINTLTRLAKNLDVVRQALSDSNSSFEDGTFLGEAFERTADNLDSKITLLKNNFDSLAAALSGGFAAALVSPFNILGLEFDSVLDSLSNFLKFLKGAEDSVLFTSVLPITAGLIALTAVFAGASAAINKVNAQILAFRVAQVNAANDPTVIQGFGRQLKALLGIGTGMIEVRDQVSGIGEKGLIEPVSFKNIFGDAKSQQKELLESRNVYLAFGDAVKNTNAATQAGAVTNMQLARLEADIVNRAIASKNSQMQALLATENASQVARAKSFLSQTSYVAFLNGEAIVISQSNLKAYERLAVSKLITEQKRQEAAAVVASATAINMETKAAAGGFGKLMGRVGSIAGIVGIVASLVPVVMALGDAIKNAGKIDLLETGGGLESLREAIKNDTKAIEDGTMEAVATAQVEYAKYGKTTDSASLAIRQLTGLSNDAAFSINKTTEEFKKQNIAIGQNTKEWIANALYKTLEDQDIDFSAIQKSMAELGLDFDSLIKDMVAAANGEEINPLAGIDAAIDKLKAERLQAIRDIGPDPNDPYGRNISSNPAIIAIQSQIDSYEDLKAVLGSVGIAFDEAFSKSAVWSAITSELGINDVENSITKLIDRYKEAASTGKGLKKVFNDLKIAAIEMTGATGEDLDLIKEAETLEGLRAVIKGMLELAKSTSIVEIRAVKASKALLALKAADKLEIETLEQALASIDAIIAGLGSGVDSLGGAAESAADKLARLFTEANVGIQRASDLRAAFRALGKTMKESSDFTLNTDLGASNVSSVLSVIESIGSRANGNFKQAERNLNIFKLTLQDMGAPKQAIDLINKAIAKLGGSTNLTKKQAEALRKEFASVFATFGKNFQQGFNEVDNVEKKIRSLTDFVGDLRGVLQSAFEIRYGAQTGLDAITTAWSNMSQAAKDALKAVKSANDEINQSMADKTVLQYQLSVAERYNDEKRAAVIRAKLAKLDEQILDQQKQLADANSANDKSLTGNTKSAIDNRAKIRDLVTQYNSYLLSLANTNMSSTDLAAKAKELESDFLAQGTALGYAEKDLKNYSSAFSNDFTKALNGIPRDITISVNTDPALRAIEEFVAKAQAALSIVGVPTIPTAPAAAAATSNFGRAIEDLFLTGKENKVVGPDVKGIKGEIVTGKQGTTWKWDAKDKEWDRVAQKAMGGYVSGAGGPTSDSIPAMLSNGEYVIQARSVAAYGLDFMNALNQQRVGFAPAQGSFSGGSASGSQMVYLSPEDRALLRAAVDRPIALYTENAKIAQSANAGNVLLAQRGTN